MTQGGDINVLHVMIPATLLVITLVMMHVMLMWTLVQKVALLDVLDSVILDVLMFVPRAVMVLVLDVLGVLLLKLDVILDVILEMK